MGRGQFALSTREACVGYNLYFRVKSEQCYCLQRFVNEYKLNAFFRVVLHANLLVTSFKGFFPFLAVWYFSLLLFWRAEKRYDVAKRVSLCRTHSKQRGLGVERKCPI